MRPDDLIEFSRLSYDKDAEVKTWSEKDFVDSGLCPDETDLIMEFSNQGGNLLLLGVGGGREAIPFAKMGYHVTGVDFVTEMVDRAKENALTRGLLIDGLVQEISNLDIPESSYDVVWLSRSMYSIIPTRKRRVEMVKRITRALKPGGVFLCQFHHDTSSHHSKKGVFLRRLIARCTMGNLEFENGDRLWENIEFIHSFSSIDAVRSEIEEGGLSVIRFQTELNTIRWGAVCKKVAPPAINPNERT